MQVKNISAIQGEVTAAIEDEEDVFQVQPQCTLIGPEEIQFFAVNVIPIKPGLITNKLYFLIKDNPKAELINMVVNGCELSFELSTHKIVFERVQIKNKATKTLQLRNKSPVPLYWKFGEIEKILKKYNIFPLCGVIKACSVVDVTIEYLSNVVEEVPKKTVEVQIFDEYKRSEVPFLVSSLEITAEAIKLQVECDSHIMFGDIKARKSYEHMLVLTNKGKYTVYFEIHPIERENLEKKMVKVLDMFKISTTSGVLPVHKTATTRINLTATKLINIKEIPIFKCTIFDKMEHVVDKVKEVVKKEMETFFITATAKSYYSE